MKEKASVTSQRLLNLYRQAHVLEGGWPAINKIFLDESDDDVLAELETLPNGSKLAEHIRRLSESDKRNTIDSELMPYGGKMDQAAKIGEKISAENLKIIEDALMEFEPDEEHLQKIQNIPFVSAFGKKWLGGVRASIAGHPDLIEKWRTVHKTARAYELWSRAYAVMTPPVSEQGRAAIQADLSEYETYLPMFGRDGEKLLARLREFVSST